MPCNSFIYWGKHLLGIVVEKVFFSVYYNFLYAFFNVAANPPTAVSANLNSQSGPVVITWSPPVSGGAEITGYRIYYNLGCLSLNVIVASTENHYQMDLNGVLPEEIMSVSIRAESAQLPSDLITVRVGTSSTTTTQELPMTTTIIEAVRTTVATTSDEMGTSTQTVRSSDPTTTSDGGVIVTLPTTGTGPVGVVIDGLQPSTAYVHPLLFVAIVEGIIIAILIIILIVTVVVFLYWR